jgi:acid stress-induced BolA-like protein IbaG/YrbA
MSIEIQGSPSQNIVQQLRSAIEEAVECRELSVEPGSPGHFSIRVASESFADLNRVKQQQLVYGAIAHLMNGDAAPVHAIDRLECITP